MNGCVIRREGVRGAVLYAKYRDADGRQVKRRLGREADGWSETKAQRELGKLLDAVEKGWRKPERTTFAEFVRRFEDEYLPGRNLKRSTLLAYRIDLANHLVPFLGADELAKLAGQPQRIDAYIAAKTAEGLSPKTIANHLIELNVVFKVAQRWRLIDANPMRLVDRPRVEAPEMNVLSEGEIAALLIAYRELEVDADPEEAVWWRLARRIVTVALGTTCRRGELLGLAWRDVALFDAKLTVRQALVRGQLDTPKSRAARRTMEVGPRVLAALEDQWAESRYRSDESLVFCHPALGSPIDASKFTRCYLRPALKKAGVTKPFRPWHDLRHTAITHEAAAGNPAVYVQMRAGHSQGSITERYIHAAQVLFPGAAAKGEERIFGKERLSAANASRERS
jgi:integrase